MLKSPDWILSREHSRSPGSVFFEPVANIEGDREPTMYDPVTDEERPLRRH